MRATDHERDGYLRPLPRQQSHNYDHLLQEEEGFSRTDAGAPRGSCWARRRKRQTHEKDMKLRGHSGSELAILSTVVVSNSGVGERTD